MNQATEMPFRMTLLNVSMALIASLILLLVTPYDQCLLWYTDEVDRIVSRYGKALLPAWKFYGLEELAYSEFWSEFSSDLKEWFRLPKRSMQTQIEWWVDQCVSNVTLMVYKFFFRTSLLIVSALFFSPMGLAIFLFRWWDREQQKGEFKYTSPFRLRMTMTLSSWLCLAVVCLWFVPFAINPQWLVILVGLTIFTHSLVIGLFQKEV